MEFRNLAAGIQEFKSTFRNSSRIRDGEPQPRDQVISLTVG